MKKKPPLPIKKENPVANFFETMATPVQKFLHLQSASGVVLILVAIAAMIWANVAPEHYEHFIHTPINITIAGMGLNWGLAHWVNDGLMVIFFFVVGMEIKRELLVGELSSFKKASLPIVAAIGGMIVPALFYFSFNQTGPTAHGWAIPMATDIAFAVCALTLLGRFVPATLMVFLLALAIVDDLGAVIVIAAFYTKELHFDAMVLAAVGLALIWILRFGGVRQRPIFFVLSLAVWLAVLRSGVHATISGVVLGFLTPLTALVPKDVMKNEVQPLLNEGNLTESKLQHIQTLVEETQSPLEKTVEFLHPWVNFLIMPLFALVNAGVILQGADLGSVFSHQVTLGVVSGLVFGKPIGVIVACIIACKVGLAELPRGINWFHIFGVGCMAGIGFTMALFVSHLSFPTPDFEVYSKVGILTASVASAIFGAIVLIAASTIHKKNS